MTSYTIQAILDSDPDRIGELKNIITSPTNYNIHIILTDYWNHTFFLLFPFIDKYYTNPLVDSNHADPGVLKLPDNSGYVAVSTGIYSDGIFPILYSEDMVHWIHVIWSYHLNIL